MHFQFFVHKFVSFLKYFRNQVWKWLRYIELIIYIEIVSEKYFVEALENQKYTNLFRNC